MDKPSAGTAGSPAFVSFGGRLHALPAFSSRRFCDRRPHVLIPIQACADASPLSARAAVLRAGVDCAVEDFVTSGTNIAIGGVDCAAVAESLAVKVETGALRDVAFMPTNRAAREAVEKFALPTDTAVNHGSVDTFLACVSQLDAELNAALGVCGASAEDGYALRTERIAAELATQTVVVVPEVDFDSTSSGILSFPVHLDALFEKKVLEALRGDALLDSIGVRSITERGNGSHIADVLLRPASDLLSISDIFQDMQGIRAVGILPTSTTTTAVVAAENEAYDITSSLSSIAELLKSTEVSSTPSSPFEEPARTSRSPLPKLNSVERDEALLQLGELWSIPKDGRNHLEREFVFGNVRQAHAFMARIHRIARMTDSYPDLETVRTAPAFFFGSQGVVAA